MRRSWSTHRLLIRQLGPDEAGFARAYGLRSREFHTKWDPLRPHDFWEPHVVEARLAAELQLATEGRMLATYLSLRDDPTRVIGRIALNNIIRGAQQGCTIGYGLSPEAVGQGYMTEGLNEIVRVAFDELTLHRVEVDIVPRNEKSIAVARRCGFLQEGFSPRYLQINGTWEDHLRFAKRNLVMEQ